MTGKMQSHFCVDCEKEFMSSESKCPDCGTITIELFGGPKRKPSDVIRIKRIRIAFLKSSTLQIAMMSLAVILIWQIAANLPRRPVVPEAAPTLEYQLAQPATEEPVTPLPPAPVRREPGNIMLASLPDPEVTTIEALIERTRRRISTAENDQISPVIKALSISDRFDAWDDYETYLGNSRLGEIKLRLLDFIDAEAPAFTDEIKANFILDTYLMTTPKEELGLSVHWLSEVLPDRDVYLSRLSEDEVLGLIEKEQAALIALNSKDTTTCGAVIVHGWRDQLNNPDFRTFPEVLAFMEPFTDISTFSDELLFIRSVQTDRETKALGQWAWFRITDGSGDFDFFEDPGYCERGLAWFSVLSTLEPERRIPIYETARWGYVVARP